MAVVGVWEREGDALCRALRGLLDGRGLQGRCTVRPVDAAAGGDYDLVLWQDGAPLRRGEPVRAAILVVGGQDARRALTCCGADTVITVGLAPRDTLTLSSALCHEGGMASLQRAIPSLGGLLIPPREVLLDGLPGPVGDRLLLRAALLACGSAD